MSLGMTSRTPEEVIILVSHERKMKLFNAIDEAFAKVNSEFDNEENQPSFQEMYESIDMLKNKVRRLEMDAYFAYKSIEASNLVHIDKPSHIQ